MITYIFSIILGNKFKFLNAYSLKKYKVIRNFNKLGTLIACSRKIIISAVLLIIFGKLLLMVPLLNSIEYSEVLINSIMYVSYFFLIQDSISTINKGMYILSRSRFFTMTGQLVILITLVNYFFVTFPIMVIGAFLVEYVLGIKKRQNEYMEKFV